MRSLAARITLLVLVAQAVLAGGLAVFGVVSARRMLTEAFDIVLRGRADSVLASVQAPERAGGPLRFNGGMLALRPGDAFSVREASGRLVARSGTLPQGGSFDRSGHIDFRLHGECYRGLLLRDTPIYDLEENQPGPPARVTLLYVAPTRSLDARIRRVEALLVGLAALVLCVAGVLTAVLVRHGLGPVRLLAADAEAAPETGWRLHVPDPVARTAELVPLAESIQTMLAAVRASLERERQFTADAAHELKTAVAILKSSLQLLALRPRGASEYVAGLGRALEDCGRMERLVGRMLHLAQLEAEPRRADPLEAVDLEATCRMAAERVQAAWPDRRLALDAAPETLLVAGDAGDLEILWTNLLENAVRHDPKAFPVVLRLRKQSGWAEVEVSDGGPGIAPEDLPHVFERFRRGDRSRSRATGGFGLGLAIARAVAVQHSGAIEIESGPRGTTVRVRLPLSSAPPAEASAPRRAGSERRLSIS